MDGSTIQKIPTIQQASNPCCYNEFKKKNPTTSFELSKNHRSNHRLLLPIETGEKKQKKRIVRIKQQSILIYADPLQVGARYDLCEIPGETDSWYAQLQTGHAK